MLPMPLCLSYYIKKAPCPLSPIFALIY